MKLGKLSAILLVCLCLIPRAQAEATLFLGEPYSYDGAFAGTGHAAVYLSGVCATSPVVLRRCNRGETGIVLSRYLRIAGYDWIAIPLLPYLYAVEKREDIPLFADKKVVAFLRDRYRRDHLKSLVPDFPGTETPDGNWYELIGASYIRTIYALEIETSPEQDEKLIRTLNERPNRQRWNLVTGNCADFARQIISLYYPHSVHRSIIGDLGVTTPKQLARSLFKYSRRHPELRTSRFVIPQVPGTIPRSKRVRGVLEVILTSKKYMLPIFLFHPYAAVGLVALYMGHWHFNPGKNALVLDSRNELSAAVKRSERHVIENQMEELLRAAFLVDTEADDHHWMLLHDAAQPAFDASGGPILRMHVGDEVRCVGIARSNILNFPTESEFAARLVKARLDQELKSAAAPKTAYADLENDVVLLQQLLAPQQKELASRSGFAPLSREGDH